MAATLGGLIKQSPNRFSKYAVGLASLPLLACFTQLSCRDEIRNKGVHSNPFTVALD